MRTCAPAVPGGSGQPVPLPAAPFGVNDQGIRTRIHYCRGWQCSARSPPWPVPSSGV
jgi:hypothetical protein